MDAAVDVVMEDAAVDAEDVTEAVAVDVAVAEDVTEVEVVA